MDWGRGVLMTKAVAGIQQLDDGYLNEDRTLEEERGREQVSNVKVVN